MHRNGWRSQWLAIAAAGGIFVPATDSDYSKGVTALADLCEKQAAFVEISLPAYRSYVIVTTLKSPGRLELGPVNHVQINGAKILSTVDSIYSIRQITVVVSQGITERKN